MQTVLGINGGFRQGYQDVSACLVKNGQLLAAVEEERLSRVKFSPGRLPYLSVKEVLAITGLSITDVDVVAFHGSTWGTDIEPKLETYFREHFGHAPAIRRYHHHDCHAASAYYASGFEKALVFTMDNSGDGISLQVSVGEKGHLHTLKRFERPQSLGVFYSLITQYCGFTKDSDEYKLMGLAAYGNAERFDFLWLLDAKDGEYRLNTDYIETVAPLAPSLHRDEMNFNDAFVTRMGQGRRLPGTEPDAFYKDVAASAQRQLENAVLHLLEHYVRQTGIRRICTAGGVALNCLMNQKLMNADFVDELFVQPASSDAGISLGAAWLAAVDAGTAPVPPAHTFLGSSFTNEAIQHILDICGVAYQKLDDPVSVAAEYLANHRVIGWFQGAMEFGPRALGNRSILAHPSAPGIQALLNRKIKFRESFRPFGASVLEEDSALHFEGKNPVSPYMTVTYRTKPESLSALAGVTHADGTCRIQTVNPSQNLMFYELLRQVKAKTGIGVCLNTSFNLNHEPIVHLPQQALASFFGSGIDALFLGNFLVEKGTNSHSQDNRSGTAE